MTAKKPGANIRTTEIILIKYHTIFICCVLYVFVVEHFKRGMFTNEAIFVGVQRSFTSRFVYIRPFLLIHCYDFSLLRDDFASSSSSVWFCCRQLHIVYIYVHVAVNLCSACLKWFFLNVSFEMYCFKCFVSNVLFQMLCFKCFISNALFHVCVQKTFKFFLFVLFVSNAICFIHFSFSIVLISHRIR